MKLKTFCISLNNPLSTYTPGEDVSGKVVIDPGTDAVETQGVVLRLTGNASVHWMEFGQNGSKPKVDNYNGFSNVLDHGVYLRGDGQGTITLSPGETTLPFTFTLPRSNIPGSFYGNHGKVEYGLKATLKRKGLFADFKVEQVVIVAPELDLNLNRALALPKELSCSKSVGYLFWESGPLTLNVKLGASGFCLGESFPFLIEVYNGSTRKVNNVTAVLLQEVKFEATKKTKRSYKELTTYSSGEEVAPAAREVWRGALTVPRSATPTSLGGGCKIIDVQYFLKVEGHLWGIMSNVTVEVPVTIGTVAIENLDLWSRCV